MIVYSTVFHRAVRKFASCQSRVKFSPPTLLPPKSVPAVAFVKLS